MNLKAVAERIKGVTATTIEDWEKGKTSPTFSQLERLTFIYKRPLTAFLLPAPPEEATFPADYRTFPSEEKKPLHP
ncbi:MAG: helix-turn-helix transcriptional regulator, partial [bacterium]|nr:helix-turn-helix transcriptional regulator [bacterium]